MRLLHWEGLAHGPGELPEEARRTAHYRRKVEAFSAAQRDGLLVDDPDAPQLLFLVLALVAWWFAVPQIARMITGSDADDDDARARRRAAVVRAARQLARAR